MTRRLVILRFMVKPAGRVGSKNCAKIAGRVGSGYAFSGSDRVAKFGLACNSVLALGVLLSL